MAIPNPARTIPEPGDDEAPGQANPSENPSDDLPPKGQPILGLDDGPLHGAAMLRLHPHLTKNDGGRIGIEGR